MIGIKLRMAFLSMAALVASAGILSHRSNHRIRESLNQVNQCSLVISLAASQLLSDLMQSMSHLEEPGKQNQSLANLADCQRWILALRNAIAEGRAIAEERESSSDLSRENDEFSELERFEREFRTYEKNVHHYLAVRIESPNQAHDYLHNRLSPHFHDRLLPKIRRSHQVANHELRLEADTIAYQLAESNRQMSIVLALSFLVAMGLGAWATKTILYPLDALGNAAKSIGQGDWNVFIATDAKDEIGALGRSLAAMVNDLKDYRAKTVQMEDSLRELNRELEQRVEQRTQQLLTTNAALMQEITTRMEAESRLARSLSLVQATLESTVDGLLVVSWEGKIVGVNKRFGEMWGIPQEILDRRNDAEVLGRGLQLLKNPQQFRQKVEELYAQPEKESFDTFEFVDGRIIERYSRPQVLLGKSIGRVWSFRDVTQKKRLELEAVQNGKMVAMGQLAAGVAHDLNNPLTVILGFAQKALSEVGNDGSPLRRALEAVEREAQRCRAMIQNMLLFARRQNATVAREPLSASVEGALALVQTLASAENIELAVEISRTLPVIEVDSVQMERLVINLCANAIDAMENGGELRVTLTQNPGGVVLGVQDTGSGIPPEVQSHMFEPFFTTKERGKGTGLGLSLVKETAAAHGASIEVESEIGKGTAIRLTFPSPQAASAAA